jgi:glutamate/tyrosine decarboxylase-like PLP-dependent enzyme
VSIHDHDPELAAAIFDAALARLEADVPELGLAREPGELTSGTITPEGLGRERALALLRDDVLGTSTAIDHPRYMAFIPGASTPAAALVDLLMSVHALYGGSWIEAAGAVHAENEALAWLASLAGFPETAGGCFVQGGTNGNLSALHAAREKVRHAGGRATRAAVSEEVHSSVRSMLRVMDAGTLDVPGGRLTGDALRAALDADGDGVFAVVATAGTTNLGLIDDLPGIADVCRERGLWLHVDGAYGLGALCAPSARAKFTGLERADSFIVDPHKWLYAPFDSCALVYRDPAYGRAAHRQHASYLESLYVDDAAFNPSDYGVHLTRRPRGVPFWFSVAVHGTDAYAEAVERTLALTREAADEIRGRPQLELVAEPELSVVVFRRRGWSPADYVTWAAGLRGAGTAFVLPTVHAGETVARLAFVSPRTTLDDVRTVLDAMGG